jgi:hypothetical protein
MSDGVSSFTIDSAVVVHVDYGEIKGEVKLLGNGWVDTGGAYYPPGRIEEIVPVPAEELFKDD